jgi:LytR cell envelope-related transcriptional attenuator
MATTPFAISVHHFISSVGADVGFASIIGLAILVLLYFSQARETANLREQAYEANQRVAQLEARLTTMARQQQTAAAAQPPPAQEAAAQQAPAAHAGNQAAAEAPRNPFSAPVLVGTTAVAPSPPAGVAAPALTAATKLIPTDPVIADPAAPHVPDPLELTPYSAPAPATAAGGSNGVSGDPLATTAPPRVTPPPARAAQQAQRGPRGTQPPRSRPGTQPPRGPERRRSRAGLRFGLLIGALALAGVVVALVLISRGSGSSASSSSTRAASTAPPARKAKDNATVNPANVTVTVLNGTATAGLADRVATQLTGVGYKQGTVGNASDQTRTATVVAYLPGQRSDALAVARSLKLGPSSVQPVDSSTRAVACPGSTTCSAQVVVTVGSDLAA